MVIVDGSRGEGGGQILRSSLALSLCLGTPFRITNIRKARARPGLQPQHLAAVAAAVEVGSAAVKGAEPGSTELEFRPKRVRSGEFRFAVGTAGSTTLVLQTVLPALLTAGAPSRLLLEGGTHNPLAPSFDFLERAFLPCLNRMGPQVSVRLERPGFYPAGGGRVHAHIRPVSRLRPLYLLDRGPVHEIRARAMIAHLPEHIARRELRVVESALGLEADRTALVRADSAAGPGNVLTVEVECEHVREVFTGFGERGVRAEVVAAAVVAQVRRYLRAGVPVGEYLADQLLLPLALAGGAFETLRPTTHALTNLEVIGRFLGGAPTCEERGADRWRVSLR